MCYNNNTTITLTGNSGTSIQWQQSADGVAGWANVTGGSGANTAIYTTPNLTVPTYYRAQGSGSCTGYSNVASVSIIALPTITLGTSPIVSGGSTSANLPYTSTTGSPNQYSITYDATAHSNGFVDVAFTTLTSTPIVLAITLPGGPATQGMIYNGTITVINTSTGCSSIPVAFTIDITSGCPGSNPGTTLTTSSNVSSGDVFTLSMSNITSGISGLTYQWQSSTDNVTYANISGATSQTYTGTESTSTWYHCYVICLNGGLRMASSNRTD